nr:MAG TPA: hypothetical protein [Caudoviricetes sp.]
MHLLFLIKIIHFFIPTSIDKLLIFLTSAPQRAGEQLNNIFTQTADRTALYPFRVLRKG